MSRWHQEHPDYVGAGTFALSPRVSQMYLGMEAA